MKDDNVPLYAQIRAALTDRIASGEFRGGACLPSEMALAAGHQVSQGTVRKAIDAMVVEGILTRRQGKGTFVVEQTVERARYRFFRMVDQEGARVLPEPGDQTIAKAEVSAGIAAKLDIEPGDDVYRIERTRKIAGQTALLETIVVPTSLMPDLDGQMPLPNALYPFYQSVFGLSVISTDDVMSAVTASPKDTEALGRSERTALLVIERVARDLTGRPLEWRRMRCLSQHHAWAVTLR